MAEMTLEQQRAMAMASARLRLQETGQDSDSVASIPTEGARAVVRGVTGNIGAVLNTPQNVANLVKAGVGVAVPSVLSAITGQPSERYSGLMPEVDTGNLYGSRLQRLMNDVLDLKPTRTDTTGQMLNTFGEIAGGGLVPGTGINTFSGLATNVVAPAIGGAVGEQIGGDAGKFIGSMAAPLGVKAAAGSMRGLARGVGQTAEDSRDALRVMDDAGIPATLADISPSRAVVQNSVARIPGASNIIGSAIKKQSAEIEQKIRNAVPDIDATPIEAGKAIQSGLEAWKTRFQGTYRNLANRVNTLLPDSDPITPSNYMTALQKLTTPNPGAPSQTASQISPAMKTRLETLVDDLNNGNLTVGGMRKVKEDLGQELSAYRGKLVADVDGGAKKLLYKALSQDLEAAASARGPEAFLAMKKANAYYSAGMDRIDNFFQKLYDKADPQHAYNALLVGGRKGSEEIRTVMKSLRPQERDIVASAVALKLGQAVPSQQTSTQNLFSFETMLTRWAQLEPEAKRTLFGSVSKPGFISDMDRISAAATKIRESGKILHNPSGTSQAAAGSLAAYGMFSAPLETLTTVASAGMSAALMSNPRFVRWLAQSTTIPKAQYANHLTRLSGMANSDPEIAAPLRDYINAVKTSAQER